MQLGNVKNRKNTIKREDRVKEREGIDACNVGVSLFSSFSPVKHEII